MPPSAAQQVTAQPTIVNLALYAGDDCFLDVIVTETDGSAADLAGCTAEAQIRSDPASTEVLATWTPTIEGDTIHLHLSTADSANLPIVSVWDVQVTDANGVVTTLAAGTVSMKPEVTR